MLLFVALSAFAQETDPLTDTAAPRAQYQAVTLVEFDRVKVDGKLEGPGVGFTVERPAPVHPSLIRVRVNFDDEVAGSVDQL